MPVTRRAFLMGVPAAGLLHLPRTAQAESLAVVEPAESFPAQDPAIVREMVVAAHANVRRVREFLSSRPALANATWDWGFGDWESPLGAASHMGNHEIARMLIEAGARPTIFSAAMLGQLDVVKAFIAAAPGSQRIRGPHGIPLLAHAHAGRAREVVAFLETLGDAGVPYRNEPLDADAANACAGVYAFGPRHGQQLVVSMTPDGLTVRRGDNADRRLFHQGARVFHPAGAPSAVLRFAEGTPVPSLTVEDGPVRVTARRQ